MTKKDSDNILIRNLSEMDKEILAWLREHYQESTNSQTTLKTLRDYKILNEKLDAVNKMCKTLLQENSDLRKKMDNLRQSLKDIQA